MAAGNSQLLEAIQHLPMNDPEPSCPPPQSQLSPFVRLPTEIHLEIISYFEAAGDPAILQLARVSRYFRQIIAKPNHELLLRIEQHPLAR